MLIYPGKVLAKKDKESRKWAMMTEDFVFWTKPRVITAETGGDTQLA